MTLVLIEIQNQQAMKKIITICVLLFYGQGWSQNNLFYGELGGAGPFFSVNYERQLFSDSHLNFRVGTGVNPGIFDDPLIFTIPLGVYYLWNMEKGNFLELGVTNTIVLNDIGSDEEVFLIPNIGYRKYYLNKKVVLKLTFCPIFFDADEIIPWAGISVGHRF